MSKREKLRRVTGLCLVALILVLCCTPQFRAFVTFPEHVRLPQGQAQEFAFRLPLRVTVRSDRDGALALNGENLGQNGQPAALSSPLSIAALETGRYHLDLRLFDLIPFRRMTLDVVPPIRVIPGGHAIGVYLKSRGVIVVGHAAVRDGKGEQHHPGRDGGIEVGDVILRIGGKDVTGEVQAAQLFQAAGRSGRPVTIVVNRKGRQLEKQVSLVKEKESGRWRSGLFIRESAAGVGTLTFYEPVSGKYGALGHVIADAETTQPIELRSGHIVDAVVTAIQKGRKGAPGEKISRFHNEDNWLGTIERNTHFGIFGRMHRPPANPFFQEPIPVAMSNQVKEGPAEILTVIEGQKLERFTVEIVRLTRQPTQDGKNMVVRITDERLLAKTGGIVQGMSGSPILQEGRVVGAITHVFVNDPTRGYGALIEWMLQEAGVLRPARGSSSREVYPPGLLAFCGVCNGSVTPDMLCL